MMHAKGDKTEEAGGRRMMMAYLWTFSSPKGETASSIHLHPHTLPVFTSLKKKYFANQRFSVTSNLRYMHKVLNVDEIKN
jgi:hypothetical protein